MVRPKVRDALIVTKEVGSAGAAMLLRRYPALFRDRFPRSYLKRVFEAEDQLSVEKDLQILSCLTDVSGVTVLGTGGFYQGLWEFVNGTGMGFYVDLGAVPIRQETVELTEVLQEDPYRLNSAGSVIAAVRDPEEALAALFEAGISAAVIGEVRKAPEKTVLRDGEVTHLRRPSGTGDPSVKSDRDRLF